MCVLQLVVSAVHRRRQQSRIAMQRSFYVAVGGGADQKLVEGPSSVNGPFRKESNFTNTLFLPENFLSSGNFAALLNFPSSLV